MNVRRARREDARAIAQVHAETWQQAYEHVFGAELGDRIHALSIQTQTEDPE